MAAKAMRALVLALVAASCVGCSAGGVERDDLIGDFQADHGFGIESLRLARDGHYDQLFRVAGEDTWTANSGMWEFRSDQAQIVLHDSLVVYDNAGKLRSDYRQPVAGVRTLQVKKNVRTISVIDDGAPEHAFKKLG